MLTQCTAKYTSVVACAITLACATTVAGIAIKVGLSRPIESTESFSWRVIEYDFADMVRRVAADGHAPGYFIFLKVWSGFCGREIAALRAFSVIMFFASLLIIWKLTRELHSKSGNPTDMIGVCAIGTGFAIAALAVNNQVLSAATTARMYMLGTLLCLLVAWSLWRTLQDASGICPWIAFVVAGTTWCYVHHFALVTMCGVYPIAALLSSLGIIKPKPHFSRSLLIAGGIIGVLYSPWISVLLRQSHEVYRDFWIPYRDLASFGDSFISWTTGIPNEFRGAAYLSAMLWLVTLFSAILVAIARNVEPSKPKLGFAATCLLMALVPWIVSGIVTFGFGRPLVQERYFLSAYASVLVGACAFSASMPSSPGIACVLPLLFGTNLIGTLLCESHARMEDPFDAAVVRAADTCTPGDVIIVDYAKDVNRLRYYLAQTGKMDICVKCDASMIKTSGHVGHLAACGNDELLESPHDVDFARSSVLLLTRDAGNYLRFRTVSRNVNVSTFGSGDGRMFLAQFTNVPD